MTAIVLTPATAASSRGVAHLDIFPGAATPAVFAVGRPFWIGYGFTIEASGFEDDEAAELPPGTRFELVVDGSPTRLVTDTRVVGGRRVGTQSVSFFRRGLPAGWHRFEGRWFDESGLALTSDVRIEFVEP